MRAALLILLAGCGRIGFDARSVGSPGDGGPVFDGKLPTNFPTANIVFVTSTTVQGGSLGSLANADAICQARARAGGLPGNYVAWLSTPSTNARDRLLGASGWVRLDGKPFASTIADISSGAISYPIRIDELGHVYSTSTTVLTATLASGGASPDTCGDLVSPTAFGTEGDVMSGPPAWTEAQAQPCSVDAHLYCFGIDLAVALDPLPPPNHRAFVTKGAWLASGGIGDADSLCQTEAIAAGLAPSYLALLASNASSAAGRFAPGSWWRSDGVLVTTNFDDLVAPIDRAADGTPVAANVWAGFSDPHAVGDVNNTCLDWSFGAPDYQAIGAMSTSSGWGTFAHSISCDSSDTHLACFQQ